MSKNKSYAVFGLGRYGSAVAKELVENGAEVLAVDLNQDVINEVANDIPYCKCADVTDPEVIKQLGISNIDVVVISMAENLEASVMATMLCKEAGVETVIVKAATEMNCKILNKIGADKVVFPENESGIRLAKNLLSSGFMDIFDLSNDVSIVELEVKEEWVGRSLIELNLRKKYGMNVISLIEGEKIDTNINPELPLVKDMKLIVIANVSMLNKLM